MSNGMGRGIQTSFTAGTQGWDGNSSRTAVQTGQYSPNVDTECQSEDSESSDESEVEEMEETVDETVAEDMGNLEASFAGISKRFRLINRIGEGLFVLYLPRSSTYTDTLLSQGTFSTVYKAEDKLYDQYTNDWDYDWEDGQPKPPQKRRRLGDLQGQPQAAVSPKKKRSHYVALKKIYVTSSPTRILNELELLYNLRGCRSVCPLITAFRHHDQVVAVLPYFPHTDFRLQYRTFLVSDMRHYFLSLFSALHFVHKNDIIHRDIKPT